MELVFTMDPRFRGDDKRGIYMNSIRFRLLAWYGLSLLSVAVFFYLAVHMYAVTNSDAGFLVLLLVFGIAGYVLINRITQSLRELAHEMKSISPTHLDERVSVHSDDEIGDLAVSFNELMDRVEEGFTREKQFIADMAHEFKTPLTTLRSDFEITLLKERDVEVYRKALEDGIVEIDKVSATLNRVLELARSNILVHEQPTKFCVSDLCAELIEELHTVATTKKITVTDDLEHMLYMEGYKERLAAALMNVLDNAIAYTPEGGTVKVQVKHVDGEIVMTVEDTGVGIPQDELSKVFERFYRSSRTKRMRGTGLGLAITKSIVEAHMGTIEVGSAEGRGTRVTLRLPLLEKD